MINQPRAKLRVNQPTHARTRFGRRCTPSAIGPHYGCGAQHALRPDPPWLLVVLLRPSSGLSRRFVLSSLAGHDSISPDLAYIRLRPVPSPVPNCERRSRSRARSGVSHPPDQAASPAVTIQECVLRPRRCLAMCERQLVTGRRIDFCQFDQQRDGGPSVRAEVLPRRLVDLSLVVIHLRSWRCGELLPAQNTLCWLNVAPSTTWHRCSCAAPAIGALWPRCRKCLENL